MNLQPLFDPAWTTLLGALGSITFQTALDALMAWLTPKNVLEAASAALGVGGAYLLAVKSPRAGWAFVLWLLSNLGWVAFGWLHAHWFLMAQHLAYAVTSATGIWIWLALPMVDRALADPGVGDDS
jgi:hypothetical protein